MNRMSSEQLCFEKELLMEIKTETADMEKKLVAEILSMVDEKGRSMYLPETMARRLREIAEAFDYIAAVEIIKRPSKGAKEHLGL